MITSISLVNNHHHIELRNFFASYSCTKYKVTLTFKWLKTNECPDPGRRPELWKIWFTVTCLSRVACVSLFTQVCLWGWGGPGAVEGPTADANFISLKCKQRQDCGAAWLLLPSLVWITRKGEKDYDLLYPCQLGTIFPRHRWGNWGSRWGWSNWDPKILFKVTQLVSASWIKPGSAWCQSHTLSTRSPSALLHWDAPQCPCAIDRNESYYR